MTEFLRFTRKVNLVTLFFVLSFLFLPTQLGKHFWPSFSFILGARSDYLSPTIYLSDIFIFCFIVFSYWQKKIFLTPKLAFFIIFLAIGIYFSLSPILGWYGFVKVIEFLIFAFAIRKFLTKKNNFVLISVLFSMGILFESFLAFLQFLHHGSIGGMFYFFGERFFSGVTPGIANVSVNGQLILRPYATFPHPNVLGGFLLVGMIFVLGGLVFAKKNFEKTLFITTLFIGTFGLLITFSRLASVLWLFLVIYFCIYLLSQKEFHKETMVIVGLFLVITVFFLAAASYPTLISHILSSSIADEAFTERILLSGASFKMLLFHPIFGVGLYNFLNNLPIFIGISNPSFIQPVHNIFFLIATEIGFVGFGFVSWFLIKLIMALFSQYKKIKSNERFLIVIAFFSLSVIITLGQIDHYFLTVQQGQMLTAFILGFCFALIPSKSAK